MRRNKRRVNQAADMPLGQFASNPEFRYGDRAIRAEISPCWCLSYAQTGELSLGGTPGDPNHERLGV